MAKAAKSNGHASPRRYKAYLFRDKEPVIDMTRTMLEDVFGRRVDHKMLAVVEKAGGPTVGCMSGWFFGKTCRPQNQTVEATGRAVGYQRVWVKKK